MDRTVKIQITGKVQGVWFRASAKDEALLIGLKGKIWNNPDGSVGAIVQGDMDNINLFIEWCWKGPGLAKVENVLEDRY
ncbi:MAG: acylphosphatase [Saprospiraceae bacterium]|uniref:acylphosphatase n=1 Tax=Candidatus Opimibacter skivensis TaxID=2982028 RepID=A0A9D7ST12_9BACT|nr:acylphosphatase [Candidatus Opimibacter skivensis]